MFLPPSPGLVARRLLSTQSPKDCWASCGHRPVRVSSTQVIERQSLADSENLRFRKLLILFGLQGCLAALDDVRNGLIREAA